MKNMKFTPHQIKMWCVVFVKGENEIAFSLSAPLSRIRLVAKPCQVIEEKNIQIKNVVEILMAGVLFRSNLSLCWRVAKVDIRTLFLCTPHHCFSSQNEQLCVCVLTSPSITNHHKNQIKNQKRKQFYSVTRRHQQLPRWPILLHYHLPQLLLIVPSVPLEASICEH